MYFFDKLSSASVADGNMYPAAVFDLIFIKVLCKRINLNFVQTYWEASVQNYNVSIQIVIIVSFLFKI